jgi:hypothetical protein
MARDFQSQSPSRDGVADWGVVPMTVAKETSHPEGRPQPVRNPGETAKDRTQGRGILPAKLARVNEADIGQSLPGSLWILREEPSARKTHARICEGGVG